MEGSGRPNLRPTRIAQKLLGRTQHAPALHVRVLLKTIDQGLPCDSIPCLVAQLNIMLDPSRAWYFCKVGTSSWDVVLKGVPCF